MIFLPVVERELRVASRRRGTYWNRALAALIAILITVCVLVVATREPTKTLGKTLFGLLSGVFFFGSLLAGIRHTADCLSEEKREGTLGLLFLTDLKGYDVVLGKLAATSLNAFYGLLAVLPVMALPLLMGGVAIGEFWRMVVVLLNTMFFSLAVGLLVSSVSRTARKAMAVTFLLVLLINAGPPALGAYAAYQANWTGPVKDAYLVPSAGYAYGLVFDGFYRTRPDQFLWSVLTTHGLSWFFLALAAVAARRTWQDRPAGATAVRWRDRWQQWSYGNAAQRVAFRTRLLNINPCLWLGGRHRLKPMLVWGFLGLLGCLWFWGFLKWREDDWLNEATYLITGIILNTTLKLWLASEACQKLGPDRRAGALELLLSTPLPVKEILRGQMLALKRQFLWPVLFVTAIDLILMFAGLREISSSGGRFWLWMCLAGISVFVLDVYALSWVGLWIGLTARHSNRATGATVARVLLLPWFAWFAATLAMSVLDVWRRIRLEEWTMLGLWLCFSVVASVGFCLWARLRLHQDLREIATLRFTPRARRFGRLFPRSSKAAALPPPIIQRQSTG